MLNSNQANKVLITGGAGFIGSHLAEKLVAMGYQVSVIDDLSTGRLENIEKLRGNRNFHFLEDSVTNDEALAPLISRVDLVYHLASSVGVQLIFDHPMTTMESSFRGTQNVFRLAQHYGGKKVIFASTSEVYGNSPNAMFSETDPLLVGPPTSLRWSYACSKLAGEFLAMSYNKEHGLPVVIFRLFNTIGARQSGRYGMVVPRFVSQALENKPITVYGDGRQTRCFTHVADVVNAIIRISHVPEAEGQIINVGSDREISINELAELVNKTVGNNSSTINISYDEAYGQHFEDVRRRKPDISKIQRYIDYHPSTDLAAIVKEIQADQEKTSIDGTQGEEI